MDFGKSTEWHWNAIYLLHDHVCVYTQGMLHKLCIFQLSISLKEASCALYDEKKAKDPGIQEGFSWLIGLISRDFDELHQRVEREISEQKKLEEKEQAERIERVRKLREERSV